MTVAALPVQTPDVVWWALIPVILLAASGLLILTVASLPAPLPRWVAPLWTVVAGVAVLPDPDAGEVDGGCLPGCRAGPLR